MQRRKRIRIKWKNILKLLIVILTIVFAFNFIKNIIFNHNVYNNIKGSNLVINSNKKYIKLNNQNINYIKNSAVKVRINNKENSYIINNEYLTKKTNIKIKTYTNRIRKTEFDNSKALFIYDEKVANGNLTIKLPLFLRKDKVDIYGVNNDSYTKLYTKNIKNKKITFKYIDKYERYAIVYVKTKDLKVDQNIKMVINRTYKIKPTINPKYSTYKKVTFQNVDKKYISIKNNIITSKKEGSTSFYVVCGKYKKKVNVVIINTEKKVSKKNGIYYIDGIMLVNKSYSITKKYDPKDLLDETKEAFRNMQNAAFADGITLWIVSGYRSYTEQAEIYNNYVKSNSKEEADTYSARPGYSEHQTGYVIDVNDATSNFENTNEAMWLQNNSYKYGFIIRYPKDKEEYTGYKYEPWHLRYIGKEKATKITESGLSLEEYYGIESKYKD